MVEGPGRWEIAGLMKTCEDDLWAGSLVVYHATWVGSVWPFEYSADNPRPSNSVRDSLDNAANRVPRDSAADTSGHR